jgi:hypothetical protein
MKQTINTLKNWFKRSLKPTENQFHDWLDSFWHKDAADIPQSSIQDLVTVLNSLASNTALTSAINALKDGVPVQGDTLNKLYNLVEGINSLTAQDIDTIAELNAILTDADLVRTSDMPDIVSLATAGGTLTIEMSGKSQRVLIGDAPVSVAKTLAESNAANLLAYSFVLDISNVAAVLTLPVIYEMQSSDARWNSTSNTFTPNSIGRHEFSVLNVGSIRQLIVSDPFS